MNKKLTKKASLFGHHALLETYRKTVDGKEFEFPVLTETDVKMSDALLKRILPVPKYQNLIQRIKDLMGISKILNIVTGENASQGVLVEGVLKCAIPPATNKVFKGFQGGYTIDASDWDNAPETFRKLISGDARKLDDVIFPQKLEELLSILTPTVNGKKLDLRKSDDILIESVIPEVNVPAKDDRSKRDLAAKRQEFVNALKAARIKTRDELNRELKTYLGPTADCSSYLGLPALPIPRTNEPSPFGGYDEPAGEDRNPTNAFDVLTKTIAQIELLKKEKRVWEKRALDRGYTAAERRAIIEQIALRETKIEAARENFTQINYPFGGNSTNETGFQYYIPFQDTDFSKVEKHLTFISDIEKSMGMLGKAIETQQRKGKTPIGDIEKIKMSSWVVSLDEIITECKKAFENMGLEHLMEEPMEKWMKFVGYNGENHIERFNKITSKEHFYKGIIAVIRNLMDDTKREQSALIIHNADQTRLCAQPPPGVPVDPGAPMSFNRNPILMNFVTRQNQLQSSEERSKKPVQHRTIVFVSQNPIEFSGFAKGDVHRVSLAEPVSFEEAKALVDYKKEELIRKLRNNPQDNIESRLNLTSKDFNTIANLLLGKSTAMCLAILDDAFLAGVKKMMEEEDGMLDGAQVSKSVREIANEFVVDTGNGISLVQPKIDFDTYQYVKDSAWGKTIEGWLGKVKKIEVQWEIREELEEEKRQLAKNPDASDFKSKMKELDDEISSCDTAIQGAFGSFEPFQLLKGNPGVGKSIFCKAFAKELKFQYGEVEPLSDNGSAAGTSERHTEEFLKQLRNLRNTIVLWDEIDKAIPNANDTRHYWIEEKKAAFLRAFADDDFLETLRKNQVIVIGTCNNPENMVPAIRARFEEHTVPPPDKAEHYAGFVRNAITINKSEKPVPYVPGRPKTADAAWAIAQDMISKVDADAIGEAFVGTGVEPRSLIKWFAKAMCEGTDWIDTNLYKNLYEECSVGPDGVARNIDAAKKCRQLFRDKVKIEGSGNDIKFILKQKPYILGFEFNTKNLCIAARNTEGIVGTERAGEEVKDGVRALAVWTESKVNGNSAPGSLVQDSLDFYQPNDPFKEAPEKVQLFRDVDLPSESQPIPPGNAVPGTPAQPQTSPAPATGQPPTATPPANPVQNAEPNETETTPKGPKGKSGKQKNETNSTDYYLNVLRKNGLLKE